MRFLYITVTSRLFCADTQSMTPKKFYKFRLLALCLIFFALTSISPTFGAAWKINKTMWSETDEKVYQDFVEALCDSRHNNLNRFIKDPKANPLYGKDDISFNLLPDCADLPYVVRAYVAYKLRLPFSYASSTRGNGGDIRYSRGNRPVSFKNQSNFKSPQDLFYKVLWVNSGNFRMAADLENSDHYPIKINPRTLVPGTIYYDPNGHVALVGKVTKDGRIRFVDAHPDKSISKPWFGTKFTKGTQQNGGGFKKWRPIRVLSDGRVVSTQNHNIPDYSNTEQFQRRYSIRGKNNLTYHAYVREALSQNFRQDPLKEFAFMMEELYEDIVYRSVAVELAIKRGINRRAHPGALPWNIYATDGVCEEISTPSRDARLKVAFKEFYDNTRQIISDIAMVNYAESKVTAHKMLQLYYELSNQYVIYYKNSNNQDVSLTFHDVLTRLFYLSFDPYHSPELRWGATSAELASANDNETKRRFYQLEQKLRNNLERVYGRATPLSFGPDYPIEVNIKNWLEGFIRGEMVDTKIVSIVPEQIVPSANVPTNITNVTTLPNIPSFPELPDLPSSQEMANAPVPPLNLRPNSTTSGYNSNSLQEAQIVAQAPVVANVNNDKTTGQKADKESIAAEMVGNGTTLELEIPKNKEEKKFESIGWVGTLRQVAKAISNPENYSAE